MNVLKLHSGIDAKKWLTGRADGGDQQMTLEIRIWWAVWGLDTITAKIGHV